MSERSAYVAGTLTRRAHLKDQLLRARRHAFAAMDRINSGLREGPDLDDQAVEAIGLLIGGLFMVADLVWGLHDHVSPYRSYEQAEEAFKRALAHIPRGYRPVIENYMTEDKHAAS